MSFTLPDLPYTFDALEPHIDTKTMEIHHGKHHATYISKLNDAISGTEHESKSLEDLVKQAGDIGGAVRNNGGGHWNHSFFWKSLTPQKTAPSSKLLSAINTAFGSLESMQEKFNATAATRFGSGWAWLISNNGKLEITSTPNQDNPLMDVAEVKGNPLLGVDVWEHAYYLLYQNRRPDYLKSIWNIVNWDIVSERF